MPHLNTQTECILDIQRANVFRGSNQVFENLSLRIDAGVNTAIVGPNGAGKTTLLKLLARELYSSGGEVSIYGQTRWNVWDLRKRMGIVSADLQKNYSARAKGNSVILSGFYASIDVFGHQSFSEEQRRVAQQVALELGIAHLGKVRFANMSTGEQRRHLLARALVNHPETLILDEPTSGLDLAIQFQYLQTVRELMDRGRTLILVTHQIHEIPPEVTEVVFMKNGRVTLHCSKNEALSDQHLSELYGVPIKVVSENGYFQVVPG